MSVGKLQTYTLLAFAVFFLTLIQALVLNTLSDLLVANSFWLPTLLISFLLASVQIYLVYQSHFIDTPTSRRNYYYVNWWWGLLAYLFIGAFLYWPLIILTVPPYLAIIPLLLAPLPFQRGLQRATAITVKEIKIDLPDLPDKWQDKRLAFISDVHIGQIIGAERVERIIKAINKERVEALLIGGDLFDGSLTDWPQALLPFEDLKTKHGIFYVTGNHEYIASYEDKVKPLLLSLEFRILEEESEVIDGLTFMGISHRLIKPDCDFRATVDRLVEETPVPRILLYHEPVPRFSKYGLRHGVNLQLSGHTHYGQLAPFNVLTWLFYGHFDYGLHQDDKSQNYQYTSSGIGTWGPPVRTSGHPEIVIIKLTTRDKQPG